MNKGFTFLAAALLVVGSLSAETVSLEKGETSDDFYYFKTADGAYLSLYGGKADSVVVKAVDEVVMTKAALDSALWQIVDKKIADGVTTCQIRNKATSSLLSFAGAGGLLPLLDFTADGISRWRIDGGILKGFYPNSTDYLSLKVENGALSLMKSTDGTAFTAETPSEGFVLKAAELGNGFQTFRVNFKETYEGNLFSGKDLIASDVADKAGYVTLQVKGDESYPDGTKKFLGLDTLKTEIAGAKDVFGYKFALDSTRRTVKPNAGLQQFRFTIDLKNDSVAMFVGANPDSEEPVLVVVAKVDTKQVLTVSKVVATGAAQGAVPAISLSAGKHATIADGDGVYFLKSASKGENAGRYYVTDRSFMGGDSVPSVGLPRGQWLVQSEGGKYTIVDRESNTPLIQSKEIFEVQGMEDTYLIGKDSVTVERQGVNLNNKFLGSFAPTAEELVSQGYYLSLFTRTSGVPELYMYANDSILKGSAGDMQLFKFYPVDTTVVAGARLLGDEISVISYELGGYFRDGKVALDGTDGLKFSTTAEAVPFRFLYYVNNNQYFAQMAADGRYIGIDIHSSQLQLTDKKVIVNVAPENAPEYATFGSGHKRFVSDGNSLTMNPLNFFAQMKVEGSEITKAAYEKDNFSLWVELDTVVAGKQLYFISSATAAGTRYLSAVDTTVNSMAYKTYAMFVANDTIKTMKNSPALFAFKVNEHGGYILENQSELNRKDGSPYVGIANGFVVLEQFPHVAFELETTSAPTANEEVNVSEVKVLSRDGQVIVTNASGRMITLSNILGQSVGIRRANSEYFSMPATAGIILVTVEGDRTYKVIVK